MFLAPTRPLAEQQVGACHQVVGIPERDTATMLGKAQPHVRSPYWASRRVFYCTPQTFANDLASGRCDARRIVLVVVDEAHRATGKTAQVNAFKHLDALGGRYRVLALSATPGKNASRVQEIVANLRIARVEVRSRDDVKAYAQETLMEQVVVPLSPVLQDLVTRLKKSVMEPMSSWAMKRGVWPAGMTPAQASTSRLLELYSWLIKAREGRLADEIEAIVAARNSGGGGRSGKVAKGGGAKRAGQQQGDAHFLASLAQRVPQLSEAEFSQCQSVLLLFMQLAPLLRELVTHGSRSFADGFLRLDERAKAQLAAATAEPPRPRTRASGRSSTRTTCTPGASCGRGWASWSAPASTRRTPS